MASPSAFSLLRFHRSCLNMITMDDERSLPQIDIATIVVGELETNCYLLIRQDTKEAVVIDPGADEAPLREALRGLVVTDILLTHAHFDHIGGLLAVCAAAPSEVKIWGHQAEARWPADPRLNLSAFMNPDAEIKMPTPTHILEGDGCLSCLGGKIEYFHTPGHTPGHMVYRLGEAVFTGDLVFSDGVGRTDLPGGSHDALRRSIRRVVRPMAGSTRLYPGHGPATTVEEQKLYNPYFV